MLHRFREKPFHSWLLAAVCAVVMLATFIALNNNGSANWALLLVLCPVMHILMHRFMHHTGHRNIGSLMEKPVKRHTAPYYDVAPQQRSGEADRLPREA